MGCGGRVRKQSKNKKEQEMKEHMDDVMTEMTEQEEERQKIAVRAQKEHDDQLARQAAVRSITPRHSSPLPGSREEHDSAGDHNHVMRVGLWVRAGLQNGGQ